ncbi:MAG: tetratricopeptide repeat protein [Candidatus Delongbacteria bacterium]|nr:tetratricopeptide repeat protein [Candidatus Delongbacteria bacterium]
MEYFKADLAICEEIGDKIGYSRTIGNMSLIYSEKYDLANELDCYEKKLSICEEIGDMQGIANALGGIGLVQEWKGEHATAMQNYQKNLQIFEELGDKEGISLTTSNIGNIYFANKDYSKAIEYYDRAIKIGRELRINYYLCSYLYYKANTLYKLKDPSAIALNDEAAKLSKEVEREESIFKTKVLKYKLEFMFSDDIDDRKNIIEKLKEILDKEEDKATIAELNYEIALLLYELKYDVNEYKDKAITLFNELYKDCKFIAYKNRVEELNRLIAI